MSSRPLSHATHLPRIGLSAAFFHADPARPLFKGKTLKYVEQELSHFVLAQGALAYMIPSPDREHPVAIDAYAIDLDGLVLQGGADLAPESYGEQPLRPEWSGDRVRDLYEIALVQAFLDLGKPVLGICRGAQLINVAMGGTLYQDIGTQVTGARVHRNWDIYDQNFHQIEVFPDTHLSQLHGGLRSATVCSVHHQAVKDLGRDLAIEARSQEDGVVEAIRYTGPSWMYGVQWHPEWHRRGATELLDGRILLEDFLAAARRTRAARVNPI